MGLVASLFGGSGRTDDPDPVTGLTSRDKYLIQSTWGIVRKDPTKNGVAILTTFLERHTEYHQLFPFRSVTLSQLPDNKKFQAHCNSIIYAFNSMIDNLIDPEILENIVTKIGKTHRPRNVPLKAFKELEDVILDILAKMVSSEALESWKKFLRLATKLMEKGHNEG